MTLSENPKFVEQLEGENNLKNYGKIYFSDPC